MQFVLSPQPAKAHFLEPQEQQWLQNRQDAQHKLSAERNPHQGRWWGERPSSPASSCLQGGALCAPALCPPEREGTCVSCSAA